MMLSQFQDPIALIPEESLPRDDKTADPLLDQGLKSRIDLLFGASPNNDQVSPESSSGVASGSDDLRVVRLICWIYQSSNKRRFWQQLIEQLQLLWHQ
jgi:hypothetical protein